MSGQRYAVLVAASEFPDDPQLTPLNCPERDAEDLNSVLRSESFGKFAETWLFKNQPHYEVMRQVNRVLKDASRDDLVLFYYSGHGKLDPAGRLYLATSDTEFDALEATSIPIESIMNYIDVSASTRTAIILDCCYSGAIEKSLIKGGVEEHLNVMSGGRGTFILTASTGYQVAKEMEEDDHSVFTKHLIEGIRGGAADRDQDGLVTMSELFRYTRDKVRLESHQEPMKWDLNVQGELVVALSGLAPWQERRDAIRHQLFELGQSGALPTSILTRALEITAMKRSELTGALKRYDELLESVTDDGFRAGDFIDHWLKVKPEPAPEPKSAPQEPPNSTNGNPSPRQEQGWSRFGGFAPQNKARSAFFEGLGRKAAKSFAGFAPDPNTRADEAATPSPKPVARAESAFMEQIKEAGLLLFAVLAGAALLPTFGGLFEEFNIAFDHYYIGNNRYARDFESGVTVGALVWSGLLGLFYLRRRHRWGRVLRLFGKLAILVAALASLGLIVELFG